MCLGCVIFSNKTQDEKSNFKIKVLKSFKEITHKTVRLDVILTLRLVYTIVLFDAFLFIILNFA